MRPVAANLNAAWAAMLVEELTRHGARAFFLGMGSRSAPLTVAIARHPLARIVQHVDERGAAFAALGHARGCGRPGVVVTTSGTAAANLLPAVIEASLDGVPMIVLTADRPPEARDTGANQTIDQVKLFGSYARWFADLPCPSEEIDPAYVLTTVAQALWESRLGPVHLNCMFREPLAPAPDGVDLDRLFARLGGWPDSSEPFTRLAAPGQEPASADADAVAACCRRWRRGVVVAGGGLSAADGTAVVALARTLGWPVLADIASGLRFQAPDDVPIASPDLFCLSPKFMRAEPWEMVLHLGGRMTSKRLFEFIAREPPRAYVVVTPRAARFDPAHRCTLRLYAGVEALARAVAERVAPATDDRWRQRWSRAARAGEAAMSDLLDRRPELNEPAVARAIAALIPDGHALFLGNSMPVRDADLFAARRRADVIVAANRGASGIDGTIATACGYASGSGRPVTAVVGDLAALHDLNSLQLVARCDQPVTLVIVNNNGSAVFSFLPIAEHADVYEPYFGAPHGLAFASAAAMYGLQHCDPTDMAGFKAAYSACTAGTVSTMLELATQRSANTTLHRAVYAGIAKAVRESAG